MLLSILKALHWTHHSQPTFEFVFFVNPCSSINHINIGKKSDISWGWGWRDVKHCRVYIRKNKYECKNVCISAQAVSVMTHARGDIVDWSWREQIYRRFIRSHWPDYVDGIPLIKTTIVELWFVLWCRSWWNSRMKSRYVNAMVHFIGDQ